MRATAPSPPSAAQGTQYRSDVKQGPIGRDSRKRVTRAESAHGLRFFAPLPAETDRVASRNSSAVAKPLRLAIHLRNELFCVTTCSCGSENCSRRQPMGIHRESSGAILIDSLGRLLFQQRDNNPEILYPGMIGLFGGHREGNETFLGMRGPRDIRRNQLLPAVGTLCASHKVHRGSSFRGHYSR